MSEATKRPLRGLRAFMALPEEAQPGPDSDNTSDGPTPVLGGTEPNGAGDGESDNMWPTSTRAVAVAPLASPDLPVGHPVAVIPAPGQRWAYGARKQELAARRAWRTAGQARSPLERFETVLAHLPTTGRLAINLDLVEATLAASAANTVRGLLADMAGFGEACRRSGVSALPAQPASVIAFLKDRTEGDEPARPATLARILWSIATFHRLFGMDDPTKADLVKLEMKALRRRLGTAQKQARPLRYKGAVRDPLSEDARGVSLQALMAACGPDEKGLRDRALLSVAYDTGLRASELVAIDVAHIMPASDPYSRLLAIPRHKGDQEGEGATAFLSERSVLALQAWLSVLSGLLEIPALRSGPIFRRLFIKRLKPTDPRADRAADVRRAAALRLGIALEEETRTPARRGGIDPMTSVTVGAHPLRPQAVTQLFKERLTAAWDQGLLPDLSREEFAQWRKGVSAHSTRIGMNNDLFASGEDLAGIMDALRWRSPKMPLAYNRNLAAEHGAAGRLLSRLK